MSRLAELIQELCPNGVEYKKLGEIAVDVFRGAGIKRGTLECTTLLFTFPLLFCICASVVDRTYAMYLGF